MATLSHSSDLIPSEVREPVADFLSSGLQQIERVIKGPRPRFEVRDAIGYQSKGVFFGSQDLSRNPGACQIESDEASAGLGPSNGTMARFQTADIGLDILGTRTSGRESRHRGRQNLALLSGHTMDLADADAAQVPMLLVSDAVRHIWAGTAARTMSQAFIHPIDTIKTRMQVNKVKATPLLRAWRQHSKEQTVNVFVGKHKIFRLRHWLVQGPSDLYRGLSCAILGTIPVALLYFTTYEACKGCLERRGASGTVAHLASASMGAVASAFVRVPTDTLRHQTQAYVIPNFIQGARSIVASKGVAGLYHGLLPTLLRDVPELTLQFSLYESIRHAVQRQQQVDKLQTWQHLVLGGLSGALAASATMPLDVAKTALQCGTSTSARGVLTDIVREKGMPGLFAGMGPRVAQIALQGALFFTLFEAWKAQLKPIGLRSGEDRLMKPKLWRKRRGHVWRRQFVFQ